MGGLLGGIGSMAGGKKASSAAKDQAAAQLQAAQLAAQTARLGFDWLTTGQGGQYTQPYLQGGANASNEMQGLLGIGGDPNAANKAFNNFLGSTNYKFQLGQGLNAVSGNQAAKGMLDSGSTLKALNNYGQGMAGNALQGYMTNLGNVGTQGIDMAKTIGAAGSQAGQAGASALMNGAQNASALQMMGVGAQNSGLNGLLQGRGNTYSAGPQNMTQQAGNWGNFFGNLF
jgi:hypothetical protein